MQRNKRFSLVLVLIITIISFSNYVAAQDGPFNPDLFRNLAFRHIGPGIYGGRIADIEADPDNPAVIYIAASTGGVFKSVNHGITFEPIFDHVGASVSIGDMVMKLDDELDANDGLSRALIPEVWRVVQKEGSAGKHEDERQHFLRIQVLREVATAANQQKGLEPWGRLKVSYCGLDAGSRFIQEWAHKLGLPPDDLKGGIEALLDQLNAVADSVS